ncbi:cytochrome P450 [Streptomyces galbus]|uniref:cytochrome P450 family protein n=1 Tax=Streptomyces galbus TaxID=33898 RepID=UPI00382428B9
MTDTPLAGSALFSRETDLHKLYRELRKEAPVRPVQLPGGAVGWLVTRHEDVRKALADYRLSKGGMISPVGFAPISDAARDGLTQHMLTVDPPDHTRLRRLVTSAFTPRRIDDMQPRIQRITDDLLDGFADCAETDIIGDFAFPLALQVICELLGVPVSDRDRFRSWSNVIVAGAAAGDQLADAMAAMLGYLTALIEDKRRAPADDLISALIDASDQEDRLTGDEVRSTLFLLLIAGQETTVNLIGNGVHLLLSHRETWEHLRAEPAALPGAIEEILRYESPVHLATYRVAIQDLLLGGQMIPAGSPVLVSVLSANRDDERFPDADRFDITRNASGHVAFGHGIHYCLGAPLARLEAQTAIRTLQHRHPHLRLAASATPFDWRPSPLVHGLASLPVVL